MDKMINAYIGLGSNLGDSFATIESAIESLFRLPNSRLIGLSQLYQSKAIGPGEQPDYINGAALLQTGLDAHALLDYLQAIENNHQRTRGPVRWSARTLDLDLLLYSDQEINTERLCVPHPRISERNFVLFPLADLTPSLTFPDGVCLTDLVKQTSLEGIKPLEAYPPKSFA